MRVAVLVPAIAAAALAACGAKARPPSTAVAMPVPSVQVGACARPDHDGVVGATPDLRQADRDLDGDGRPERIVSDRAMCTKEGNCYWNVFRDTPGGGCPRYAGTIAGARLEPLTTRGEERFVDLRGYWNLTGGGRFLVEEYRFVHGGYQSTGALVCRREDDDRLQCSEDPR
jgi:hypothetical protein